MATPERLYDAVVVGASGHYGCDVAARLLYQLLQERTGVYSHAVCEWWVDHVCLSCTTVHTHRQHQQQRMHCHAVSIAFEITVAGSGAWDPKPVCMHAQAHHS